VIIFKLKDKDYVKKRDRELKTMNRQSNGFTATQTQEGFHVISHDNTKEFEITLNDINVFASKYAQNAMEGKNPGLSEKEEIIFSLWEMVFIPDNTKH
jgi:hypothetical protein